MKTEAEKKGVEDAKEKVFKEMLEALRWADDLISELSDKSDGEKDVLRAIKDAIEKAEAL